MVTRDRRKKGRRWELEVAEKFREAMPGADIKRGFQFRSGGEAPDVEMPIFWAECKVGKRTCSKMALKQASVVAPQGRVPIAVCKDDWAPATVMLRLDDFLAIVKDWWEIRP